MKIPRQLAQGTSRLQAADEIQFALNSNDAGSRSSHLLLTEEATVEDINPQDSLPNGSRKEDDGDLTGIFESSNSTSGF